MGEIIQKRYAALRRCLALLLSVVMVFSTMTFTAIETGAEDEPTSTSGELEISTWTITVNGTPLTNDQTVDVTEGDDVIIEINWTFDDSYNGDYYKEIILNLSGVILQSEYISTQYIYYDGNEVGEWFINSEGNIEVKLYEAYLQESGKHGGFTLEGYVQIDESDKNDDGTYNITLGDYTYKVNYTKSAGYLDVNKSKGSTTIDSSAGTVTQEYTVTIKGNSGNVSLSSLKDTLTGFTKIERDIEVTVDGTTTSYEDMDAVSKALESRVVSDGDTITITYSASADLADVLASADSYNSFKNNIEVEYVDANDNTKKRDSTAYDVGVTKPSVSKYASSYDETTGEITWAISVKLGDVIKLKDYDVNKIVVTDTLDSNQTCSSSISWSDFTNANDDGVWTYTYTTKLTDAAYNSATSVTATNTVKVNFTENISKSTSASYTVKKYLLDKSDGVYDSSTGLVAWTITLKVPDTGLSGNDGYVTLYDVNDSWNGYLPVTKIVVNNVVAYSDGAFTNYDSEMLYKNQWNNEDSSSVNTNNFTLYFTNEYINKYKGETITIVVYTDPDENNLKDGQTITNTISLTSAQQSETDSGIWTYNEPVTANSALSKTGSISSKEDYTVEYTVALSLYDLLINNTNITSGSVIEINDKLPDGMEYVSGSFDISLKYLDKDKYSDGDAWNWPNYFSGMTVLSTSSLANNYSETCSGSSINVELTLTDELASISNVYGCKSDWNWCVYAYVLITYKATLTEDGIEALAADSTHEKTYTNSVTASSGAYKETAEASNTLTQNSIVTKNANLYTEFGSETVRADYEVIVNPDALTLGDGNSHLTATDKLGTDLILDVTSIKVYECNGITEEELKAGEDYSFSYDSNKNELTLKVPDGKSLKITYTAYINAAVGTALSDTTAGNTFTLSANYEWNNSDNTSTSAIITKGSSWAASTGLSIYKYSDDGSMTPLKDAKFDVYYTSSNSDSYSVDYNKTKVKTDITTNSNGKAEVALSSDLYGVVLALVETSAPSGYQIDETPFYFVLLDPTKTYDSQQINAWESAKVTIYYGGSSSYTRVIYMKNDPTPMATDTPTPTATNTPAPTATNTPAPTATNTPAPTATDTPAPTATKTPVPTTTETPAPTATDTLAPTATETPAPTATDTLAPTATNTPVPTATNTPAPTATDTPAPTAADTPAPTATDTPTPTPLKTTISIYKTDDESTPAPVADVTFGIYSDYECTNEVENITTLSDGKATTAQEYEAGTYYLKEIDAPSNYVKLTNVYKITIKDDTSSIVITIDGDDQVKIENNIIIVVNNTVTPTATDTPAPTATDTPAPTATNTPAPTATNTPTPSATNTPTPTATNTPTPTATDTPTPTATNTPTPTATDTPMPTATDTPTPTAADTPTPTATDTPTPTATDTPAPTATDAPTPTAADAPTPTAADTSTPTATPTPKEESTTAVEEETTTTAAEVETTTAAEVETATEAEATAEVQETTTVSEADSNLIVQVLDEETGEPVEGAVVRITNENGNVVELVTRPDGKVFGDFAIGNYTIEVVSVPDGYTVTTGQKTTVTLIENEVAEHQAIVSKLDGGQLGDSDSGTLPITGMLVWPVSLLSILGALFTIGGVVDNRKRRTE